MLYYIPEQKIYRNRKELARKIGINPYKRECRMGNVIYINDDDFIANLKD